MDLSRMTIDFDGPRLRFSMKRGGFGEVFTMWGRHWFVIHEESRGRGPFHCTAARLVEVS